MKVVKGIWNTALFVVTVAVMGIALLNFLSAPDGEGLFGYKGYTVLSGSMEPTISAGDYIVVHMSSYEDIEKGDVITFKEAGDTLVTHRAVAKAEDGWITKGDTNNTEDIQHVKAEKLVGKVNWVVPKLGRALLFMRHPLFILSLLVLLIIALLVSYYRSGTTEES